MPTERISITGPRRLRSAASIGEAVVAPQPSCSAAPVAAAVTGPSRSRLPWPITGQTPWFQPFATPCTVPAPLVLGFGNVLLGDDGAGVRVIERLGAQCTTAECECIDGGTMSFNLLPYVEAADAMLVVDAADLRAAPGTVVLFEGAAMDEFLQRSRRRTVHEIGLMDLLDMARLEDCLPRQRALLCVQPGPIGWNEGLSAPVAAALPTAVRLAAAQLQRWSLA